jgi:dihydroorotate dehydrogenase (fumarate)
MTARIDTTYLGIPLAHPVVASASPLGRTMQGVHRLAAAGAAAIVLPSLFEEQIEHEAMQIHEAMEYGGEVYAEHGGSMLPEVRDYNTGPDAYLELIRTANDALEIPVIPSLNGVSLGGWTEYARRMEDAGAPALELNVYLIAADVDADASEVETRYLDLVSSVKESLSIPLAVKVGPYFSSIANMARRLVDAGADGLVLFNRFYQPDIDLEELQVRPDIKLSSSVELRLPLRWIAILKGRVEASLAATTGVHTSEDVAKLLLAGADVAMMASALLRHGPEWIGTVVDGLRNWVEENEYESVEQLKGSMSQQAIPDPSALERANYMESLVTYATPTEQR